MLPWEEQILHLILAQKSREAIKGVMWVIIIQYLGSWDEGGVNDHCEMMAGGFRRVEAPTEELNAPLFSKQTSCACLNGGSPPVWVVGP